MPNKNNKTIIFTVDYLGRCGCGFKRKVTRKLELKDIQTLDDLHEAIIYKSFQWDDPHLYSFFMDNKPNSENREMEYSCDTDPDFLDEPRKSSNISLKKLDLKQDQKFLFLFDYGDNHHFRIMVNGFGETQKGKRYPVILEEKGKAPDQYPEYEEK
jgi:hypothetical protein